MKPTAVQTFFQKRKAQFGQSGYVFLYLEQNSEVPLLLSLHKLQEHIVWV